MPGTAGQGMMLQQPPVVYPQAGPMLAAGGVSPQPMVYVPVLQQQQQQQQRQQQQPVAAAAGRAGAVSVLAGSHPELGIAAGTALEARQARVQSLTQVPPKRAAEELARATGGTGHLLDPLPSHTPRWIKSLHKWEGRHPGSRAQHAPRAAAGTSAAPTASGSWMGGMFGDSEAAAAGHPAGQPAARRGGSGGED
eukprot:CAMPEP_0173384600 /NCGR_PEP_ID=MMETSP1356-20130122/7173_1 /TAXON_ID=77927 ORGANISM="Hemiselmis virescens, Strain PCC157" /NCGR_SAMPLE_ID=MMETSP1356 /ASSEMBLY_ACC=CAM_ASM_000847 /LENGTH=194 /DNA_ID=CAMNT_0014340031 /DNA_START=15 /DNA_END=597 /DNA_ORIENTATION=-